ncbi:hypothetical protein VOLCADRAFT_120200 [Volvox carteri f. nagariensis]|uniref:Uncharacterized protein n=1 Tax=Volvox carteri f. nagariensis TaxID=3068 RepID=D8THY2_VOLCA|nr:uncharacterized protein VOLCADRAFT_120200 [Volvox carteri f. nagariensis]EFJ52796.1 hypothetical protein VOLCADRAFT_120200 [Volvox carteri f. nagariensis]|eukprot:XP_002945801.1 hypothetical protein VOLCADRAFT_120200 [Volvox carteri f. nagariensis]
MTDQERRDGKYYYIEEFKLLLQQEALQPSQQQQVLLPPGLTAVQVVADFLAELRGYIFKHLARMDAAAAGGPAGPPLEPSSISWCLTVPAMWDEATKAKMRQAANRAAVTAASDAAARAAELREVSEHTAGGGDGSSALAAVRGGASVSSSAAAAALRDGDVLLVLDCGGGTADITMHKVVGSGTNVRLQEAAAGKGVLAGGRYVDEALWQHLRAMVGPTAWDTWRERHPTEWMEAATEWEAAKRQPRGPLTLQLRPHLLELAAEIRRRERRASGGGSGSAATASTPDADIAATSSTDIDGGSGGGGCRTPAAEAMDVGGLMAADLPADGSVVLCEGVLERRIYGPVVDQILAAAVDVLEQGQHAGCPCSKMLLVGGLANSPYVQQRVRQLSQEQRVPLLMPRQPQALVASGAVLFGQYPSLVTARRCRQTYGISCRSLWTAEDAASHTLFGYPSKLWKEEEREYVADGVFELYVRRNQLIQQDEVVRRIFCPTSKGTTAVGIDLFTTENEDARYTAEPGMRKVATVIMELPPGWTSTVQRRQDYDIEVELRFGGTEITLLARDPQTNNAVATTTNWTPEDGLLSLVYFWTQPFLSWPCRGLVCGVTVRLPWDP